MATVKNNEEKAEEKVKIKLFKDNDKYKDPVFVGVNGKGYLIERGVTVEVPMSVKEVLDNSAAQDQRASEFMESAQEEAKRKMEEM